MASIMATLAATPTVTLANGYTRDGRHVRATRGTDGIRITEDGVEARHVDRPYADAEGRLTFYTDLGALRLPGLYEADRRVRWDDEVLS